MSDEQRLCRECNATVVIGDTFAEEVVPKYPKRNGAKLVLKSGKFGDFWGCENFPECKYTEYSERGAKALAQKRQSNRHSSALAILKSYE